MIRRRELLTGAAALAASRALADGLGGSVTPQLGGAIGAGFDGGIGGAKKGFATWDPATVALATLSNGNLTFTNSTGGFNPCYAYTTSSKTAGKFVVQMTVVNKVDQNLAFGIGRLPLPSGGLASDTNSCGSYANGQIVNNAFAVLATTAAWVNGDVITLAANLTSALFWMKLNSGNWNMNASANPDTGVGGFAFSSGMNGQALFIAGDAHTNTGSGTLNPNPAGTGLTTFGGWT